MIKVAEPYARIMFIDNLSGMELLRQIEVHARVSHASEGKQTEDSYDRFLRSVVMMHGDLSVIEHVSISVEAKASRGIATEWERHRLFSYTEASTRFINFTHPDHEPEFIMPLSIAAHEVAAVDWEDEMQSACEYYQRQIARGIKPQDARGGLPLDLASRFDVSGNLRQWRHMFIMRTTLETHPEFKRVSLPLLEEFKKVIPILFEDIEPNRRQADSMRQLR